MLRRLLSRLLCWLLGHVPQVEGVHGLQSCKRCGRPCLARVRLPIVRATQDLDVLVIHCPACGWVATHPTACRGTLPEVPGE